MSRIKLFCLPYAGGSAVLYNKWRIHLSSDIELVPIELAGRGRRIHEDLYKSIPEAVEDIFNLIKKEIDQSPYALFGHSMGAMLVYHLAQKIKETALRQPLHVFISGRGAPDIERKDKKKYHLMDDDEFLKKVVELGGTTPEFFEHPELMEIFFPMLRSDFKLSESENLIGEIKPLDNNITVLLGKNEDLTALQCYSWKNHTKKLCNTFYFNGGHFFLHDETEQIVKIINNTFSDNFLVNT